MFKKEKQPVNKRYMVILNGKEGQQTIANTNSLRGAFNSANKMCNQLKSETFKDCSDMVIVGDQSNGRTYALDRFDYCDVRYINNLDQKRTTFWNKKSGKKR